MAIVSYNGFDLVAVDEPVWTVEPIVDEDGNPIRNKHTLVFSTLMVLPDEYRQVKTKE